MKIRSMMAVIGIVLAGAWPAPAQEVKLPALPVVEQLCAEVGGCQSCQNTVDQCQSDVDQCQSDLVACEANCNASGDSCQKFPATGQTTSYATPDDGDYQWGATLSFTDNGDGTITDNNTHLMWEKKSDDDSVHDKDKALDWVTAVQFFPSGIGGLNNMCRDDESVTCSTDAECSGVGGPCGFAGYQDWRLPNVKELQSIVNYGAGANSLAVSSEFNSNCTAGCTVTTCSCTGTDPSDYWSSTTLATDTSMAWRVRFLNSGGPGGNQFFNGGVQVPHRKALSGQPDDPARVRAVRGGSQ